MIENIEYESLYTGKIQTSTLECPKEEVVKQSIWSYPTDKEPKLEPQKEVLPEDYSVNITESCATNVTGEFPIKVKGNKISHAKSETIIETTTFGLQIDAPSVIVVPEITVDRYGHIQGGKSNTVIIPDTVAQNSLDGNGTFPVILAPNSEAGIDETYKTTALALLVLDSNYTLIAPNVVIEGNLTIEGSIVGTIPPHADPTTKFGVGTSTQYGHVKLQDTFELDNNGGIIPPELVEGVAASPLLVYLALQEATKSHHKIEGNDGIIREANVDLILSNDFLEQNDKIFINWLEIQ